MATRTITAVIKNEQGQPWADAELRFDLYRDYVVISEAVVVDNPQLIIKLDDTGSTEFAMVVPDEIDAAYLWNVVLPNGHIIHRLAIANGQPTTLHELIAIHEAGNGYITPPNPLTMLVAAAAASAAAAAQAAADAAQSADDAQSSAVTAGNSAATATTATDGAVASAMAASNSANVASGAADDAENSAADAAYWGAVAQEAAQSIAESPTVQTITARIAGFDLKNLYTRDGQNLWPISWFLRIDGDDRIVNVNRNVNWTDGNSKAEWLEPFFMAMEGVVPGLKFTVDHADEFEMQDEDPQPFFVEIPTDIEKLELWAGDDKLTIQINNVGERVLIQWYGYNNEAPAYYDVEINGSYAANLAWKYYGD